MKDTERANESPRRPIKGLARRVSLSAEGLVLADDLQPGRSLPLVLRPRAKGLNLAAWAAGGAELIRHSLLSHGAILFRGFNVGSPEGFDSFIKSVSGEPLEYKERSSPRHRVIGNIYTSTDYPADQHIFFHNENSYQHAWPLKLFFYCYKPARQGGETPIADVRRVFRRISPSIRERFIEKKVMYVRNFSEGLGLRWQTVFGTESKREVEDYCLRAGIEFEWKADERLTTRQVRPAVAAHPVTGESVWFNHATFFHISTLSPNIREALLASNGEEDLPNNTYYGDGSPIELSVIDELREAYLAEAVEFPWSEGDILMLDNMMVAHARNPYAGERKVLVGMAELMTGEARGPTD